jgi:pyruvate/2-oxoglutarate dehydrogenase complex dihydrolipoamide acyltransferase (E2) component
MKHQGSHIITHIPNQRIGTIDIGVASKQKHHISALVEFDVTDARRLLKEPKNDGLSFTAWLVKCISQAIEENKQIQGIRYRRRKIMVFDDIDVTIMVERDMDGTKIPFPYVIRSTNTKTILDITEEIRNAQNQVLNQDEDFVLGEKKNARMMNMYARFPAWIRNIIWKKILKNPYTIKEQMGTVMVTSVGMVARIHGWLLPKSVHPVAFTIGSIVKKPFVYQGEISIRESLYVTVTIDHDVIDGAPAMRVLHKLTKLIESAHDL